MSEDTKIRKTIRDYLDQKNLSMRALSMRVGTNPNLVKEIMNGRVTNPRRDTLVKLAQAMNLDPYHFLEAGAEAVGIYDAPRYRSLKRVSYDARTGDLIDADMPPLQIDKRFCSADSVFIEIDAPSTDGSVIPGDYVILNRSIREVYRPGTYFILSDDHPDAPDVAALVGRTGDRVLGRVEWIFRRG